MRVLGLVLFLVLSCVGQTPQELSALNALVRHPCRFLVQAFSHFRGLTKYTGKLSCDGGLFKCSKGGVVELEAKGENCKTAGPLPSELGLLSNLVSLQVSNLPVSGPIPSQIGLLTKLKTLRLNGNQISGPLPSWVSRLTNLVTLDLSNNKLHGTIPPTLTSGAVQILRLSQNSFSGMVPPLRVVRIFDISFNNFTGIQGQLPRSLETVDLSFNNLKSLPKFDAVWSLSRLVLVAASPDPDRYQTQSFIRLPLLKLLEITGNQIDEIIIDSLPFLETAILRSNKLKKIQIRNNTKLNFVDLGHNLLTTFPDFLYGPRPFQPIQRVFLANNKINVPLPETEMNSFTEFLDLSRNKIPGAGSIRFYEEPVLRESVLCYITYVGDPFRRQIDLTGNNMTVGLLPIIEVWDPVRWASVIAKCSHWPSDPYKEVTRWLSIQPQACPPDHYLSMTSGCQPCFSPWTSPFVDHDGWTLTLARIGVPSSLVESAGKRTFLSCSSCASGQRNKTRVAFAADDLCSGSLWESVPCSYPCKETNSRPYKDRLVHLMQTLRSPVDANQRQTFLNMIFENWMKVTLSLPPNDSPNKSENKIATIASMEIDVVGCKDLNMFEQLKTALLGLIREIVSGVEIPQQTDLKKIRLESRQYKPCPTEQFFSAVELRCIPCFTDWSFQLLPEIDPNIAWTSSLIAMNVPEATRIEFGLKTYNSCPSCKGGRRNMTRSRTPESPDSCEMGTNRRETCEFACKDSATPFEKRLPQLLDELRKPIIWDQDKTFINALFESWMNVTIMLPQATDVQEQETEVAKIAYVEIEIIGCKDMMMLQHVRDALYNISTEIVPEIQIPNALKKRQTDFNLRIESRQFKPCSAEQFFSTVELRCVPCFTEYTLQRLPEIDTNVAWTTNLRAMNVPQEIRLEFGLQTYNSCPSCQKGRRNMTRSRTPESPDSCGPVTDKPETCEFACKKATKSFDQRLPYLLDEMRKPISWNQEKTFISTLFELWLNVSIHLPPNNKISEEDTQTANIVFVEIDIIGCKDLNTFERVRAALYNISLVIVADIQMANQVDQTMQTIRLESRQYKPCPTEQFFSTSELRCIPCFTDWSFQLLPEIDPNIAWTSSLIAMNVPEATRIEFGLKTYNSCPSCKGGRRNMTRSRTPESPESCETDTEMTWPETCQFACKDSATVSFEKRIPQLLDELRKPIIWNQEKTFINALFESWMNVTTKLPQSSIKEEETEIAKIAYVEIEIIGCKDLAVLQSIQEALQTITTEIVPEVDIPRQQTDLHKLRIESRQYKPCPKEHYFSKTDSSCLPCFGDWTPQSILGITNKELGWVSTLMRLNLSSPWIDFGYKSFLSCPHCKGPFRTMNRSRLAGSPDACGESAPETDACEFPCKDLDAVPSTFEERLPYLINELKKKLSLKPWWEGANTFLQTLIEDHIDRNITITIPKEQKIQQINKNSILRTYNIDFGVMNCPDQKTFDHLTNVILEISKAIVPHVLLIPPKDKTFDRIGLSLSEYSCTIDEFYDVTSNNCKSCFSEWELSEDLRFLSGLDTFLLDEIKLPPQDFHQFQDYSSCSKCEQGIRNTTRKRLQEGCTQSDSKLILQESCEYPCVNPSFDGSSYHKLYYLLAQLKKPLRNSQSHETFLSKLLSYDVFGGVLVSLPDQVQNQQNGFFQFFVDQAKIQINISISTKRSLPSPQQSFAMSSAIHHLCSLIVPDIDVVASADGTSIIVQSNIIQIRNIAIIAVVVFVVAMVVTIAVVFWYYSSELRSLPEVIRWSFMMQRKFPWRWSFQGSSSIGAYFMDLKKGSKEWETVKNLFNNHCDGTQFDIQTIEAVYNPTLVSSFINRKKVIDQRVASDPKRFKSTEWETDQQQRTWICDTYNKKFGAMEWNKDQTITKFLPCVHMTTAETAKLICQTGFATLSAVDEGYYGRGVYFTSSAPYSLLYMKPTASAIILCWVIPGHIYPVVEMPRRPQEKPKKKEDKKPTLFGAALKVGFDSHYCLTTHEGLPQPYQESEAPPATPTIGRGLWDEIVISQEQQTVPAFILQFKQKQLTTLFQRFNADAKKHQQKEHEPVPLSVLSSSSDEADLESESSILLQPKEQFAWR